MGFVPGESPKVRCANAPARYRIALFCSECYTRRASPRQVKRSSVTFVMKAPPKQKPARTGRPRSFDEQAALEKAMRVFWQKGYDGTSISDLTAALGINPPSLYAAFGNKEA